MIKKGDKTKFKKKQTKNIFAKILVSSYYRHTEFHRFRNVQEIKKKTVKIIREDIKTDENVHIQSVKLTSSTTENGQSEDNFLDHGV